VKSFQIYGLDFVVAVAFAGVAAGGAAQARDLCFNDSSLDGASIPESASPYRHPWDDSLDHQQSAASYVFRPDAAEFLSVLRGLNGGWATPNDMWRQDAIVVTLKADGTPRCQVIYSKTNLYVQTDADGDFVFRPLKRYEATQLNSSLFEQTVTMR